MAAATGKPTLFGGRRSELQQFAPGRGPSPMQGRANGHLDGL
ncbi:MAG: hypothetical protein ACYDC6_02530 [Acidobacteriaceae bacterium]